jgi:hypothetical protein
MEHGTLAVDPPSRLASEDAASLQSQITAFPQGTQLLQLSGNPICGVDFYYIKFWTIGGAGETTQSSGALMVPTGAAPTCSGPRPIVLYAHGTQFEKAANIADVTDTSNTNGVLIAAMFAAQGYIVVAPNYAGYDISTLGYHPGLNARQQSGEMIDALTAARTALPSTFAASTTDSGKLFIAGFSEGGYVAMATERAMNMAGMTVTAAVPASGPYALEALLDTLEFGRVNLGSTLFAPLVTTSYQRAYGNVYHTPSDFYSATYATGIETVLPASVPYADLFQQGLLPELALFDSTTPTVDGSGNPLSATLIAKLAVPSNPISAAGFGSPFLINNDARVAYALDAEANPDGTATGSAALAAAIPTYGLRKDAYINDLRNGGWVPSSPTLMCGGQNDPTVFFNVDAGTMMAFWSNVTPGLINVLDVDPPGGPSGPNAAIQAAFQNSQQQEFQYLQTPAGGGLSPLEAQIQLIESYHDAVAPFCMLAARVFFSSY